MGTKKNKHYIIIIISLVVFAYIINRLPYAIKSMKMPPKLTAEDVEVIESFAGIQFPDSTEIIKAYWYAWDSEKLYLFFEFNKKDVEHFMGKLRWKEKDFISYNRWLDWRRIEDPRTIGFPMSVQKESNELFPSKVENLEWWVIDKENVKWGFYIDEAEQKKIDIRLSQSILLEESDETIRCFVFLWWNSLTESGKYAKDIRKIMSFDYKECQTESELYPKRKEN